MNIEQRSTPLRYHLKTAVVLTYAKLTVQMSMLAFAVLIGMGTSALAESIPYTLTVKGNMNNGLQACGGDAIAFVERDGVRKMAENLNGGHSHKTDAVADQAHTCCVKGSKFLKGPIDLGNGTCESIVKVRISEHKVKDALRKYEENRIRKGKSLVVGSVIRFMVDGKPVGQSAHFNPLAAIAAFEEEFQKYGFRNVNLTVLLEDFSLQRFGKTCAIDGETVTDCTAFEAYEGAVQTVLDRTRWAQHNNILDVQALGNGGWIAIGEVAVKREGRDPSQMLYIAAVDTTVRLYRISDGKILAASPDRAKTNGGDQNTAIQKVMLASINKVAEKLAGLLHESEQKIH
ncbi:MAG: hypothetical protein L3J26_09915 [Candidatus Polarisedimenticolaceae bacterium]|nr:hypothetical protein [Candidatus Polarisedimenticolaceae bacterium]